MVNIGDGKEVDVGHDLSMKVTTVDELMLPSGRPWNLALPNIVFCEATAKGVTTIRISRRNEKNRFTPTGDFSSI